MNKKKGGKKGGKAKETADDRVQQELQKMMMVQARMAKRGNKLRKLSKFEDNDDKRSRPNCKYHQYTELLSVTNITT
jgi:hypothetical protein